MKVEVRVFANLRNTIKIDLDTRESFILEMPEGSTLYNLLERLGVAQDPTIIGLVNGLRQTHDYALQEGDRVGFFPPVGGG